MCYFIGLLPVYIYCLTAPGGRKVNIVSHLLPVSVWSIVSIEIILLPAELIPLPEKANRSRPHSVTQLAVRSCPSTTGDIWGHCALGGTRESISKPSLSTGNSPVRNGTLCAMTSGFVSDLFTVRLDDKGQTMLMRFYSSRCRKRPNKAF